MKRLSSAVARLVALALFVALGGLPGCSEDALPPLGGACEGTSRSYAALQAGAELCDTQHLVAVLSPSIVDPRAGLGALHVPFRVTTSEPRSYCFGDDDGDAHALSMTDAAGREVLSLVAGGGCQSAALPAGAYVVRLTHAGVGRADDGRDVVHTRLTDEPSGRVLRFDVNACPGCRLTGDWPCSAPTRVEGDPREWVTCGYAGDYRGAYLDRSVCRAPAFMHTECVLSGTFDDAFVTFGSYVAPHPSGEDGTELVLGASRFAPSASRGAPSSFARATFPPAFYTDEGHDQRYAPRLVLRDVASLSGTPFAFASVPVVVEGRAPDVDRPVAEELQLAKAYAGAAAVHRVPGEGFDLSNRSWDFGRVTILPDVVDGARSFRGARFAGATLSRMAPIRGPGEGYTLADADFRGATLLDATIDATDLTRASFAGATLANVRFVTPADARVAAASLDLTGATLSDVAFGPRDAVATTPGFDLTSLRAEGARLTRFAARSSVLRVASFRGASLADVDLTGSDLSGADLGDLPEARFLTFERVLAAPAPAGDDAGARPFRFGLRDASAPVTDLSLRGAFLDFDLPNRAFVGVDFAYARVAGDFTDARFETASFAHAVLSADSTFTRARFDDVDLTGAHVLGRFDDVVVRQSAIAGASFVGATATRTRFEGGQATGAHFCGSGAYGGMVFDRLSLLGVVFPARGESYPPAGVPSKPLEERCEGGIAADERDRLVTDTATRCPDGSFTGGRPCAGAQWTPQESAVVPMCCVPERGSACNPLLPGGTCTADCACASKRCVAGTCG